MTDHTSSASPARCRFGRSSRPGSRFNGASKVTPLHGQQRRVREHLSAQVNELGVRHAVLGEVQPARRPCQVRHIVRSGKVGVRLGDLVIQRHVEARRQSVSRVVASPTLRDRKIEQRAPVPDMPPMLFGAGLHPVLEAQCPVVEARPAALTAVPALRASLVKSATPLGSRLRATIAALEARGRRLIAGDADAPPLSFGPSGLPARGRPRRDRVGAGPTRQACSVWSARLPALSATSGTDARLGRPRVAFHLGALARHADPLVQRLSLCGRRMQIEPESSDHAEAYHISGEAS